MSSSITSDCLSSVCPPAEKATDALPESVSGGIQEADEVVMQRIQSGDKEALGLLFDRYSRLIFGLGMRILKDKSEAQELIQDVFLYVYQKGAMFDAAKGTLRSWLVQIAYSRAFDKRGYLKYRHFYDHLNVDDLAESLESSLSMEDYGESVELQKVVHMAFAELTERQRLTLQMFFFGGYSIKEISSHLDESIANTRNHYYRGLDRIRERVKKLMISASSNRA